MLDINLRGEMAYPLARPLKDCKVPFLYDAVELGTGFEDVEFIRKPLSSEDVIRATERLTNA